MAELREALEILESLSAQSIDREIERCQEQIVRLRKLKRFASICRDPAPACRAKAAGADGGTNGHSNGHRQSAWFPRILSYLEINQPARGAKIAADLGTTDQTVSGVLLRHPDRFAKTVAGWTLVGSKPDND